MDKGHIPFALVTNWAMAKTAIFSFSGKVLANLLSSAHVKKNTCEMSCTATIKGFYNLLTFGGV